MKKRCLFAVVLSIIFLICFTENAYCETTTDSIKEQLDDIENPVHHHSDNNPESDVTDWSYVTYGNYPQSEIFDEGIIQQIDSVLEDEGKEEGDVTIDSKKYRKAFFYDYPWLPKNGGNYHYYIWEPIKWRVLQYEDSKLLVMADNILDAQCYLNDYKDNNSDTVNRIKWETSDIRNWLNSEETNEGCSLQDIPFFLGAFSDFERRYISSQEIKTDQIGGRVSAEETTDDRIFLLSYEELLNAHYGFCPENICGCDYHGGRLAGSKTRALHITDYARGCVGIKNGCFTYSEGMEKPWYLDNYGYFLRTPSDIKGCVLDCGQEGWIPDNGDHRDLESYIDPVTGNEVEEYISLESYGVNADAKGGVVPAMYIDVSQFEKNGFSIKRDGYSFENDEVPFDYPTPHRISLQRYKEVYGENYTTDIHKLYADVWGGNCWGMSVTSGLFYRNRLNKFDYIEKMTSTNKIGSTVNKRRVIYSEPKVQQLIERYQIWQDSIGYDDYFNRNEQDYGLSDDLQTNKKVISRILANTEENTFLVSIFGADWGHAMVLDTAREYVELDNDWVRMYLYDPNCPYYSGYNDDDKAIVLNRYVDINPTSGQWECSLRQSDGTFDYVGFKNGQYIEDTFMQFANVETCPTVFDGTAKLSDDDETIIKYADIIGALNIFDKNEKLIYAVSNGKIIFKDEVIDEIIKSRDNEISKEKSVKLKLPKGVYKVESDCGAISFLSENDYTGVKSDAPMTVTNLDSSTLSVSREKRGKVTMVIEDTYGNDGSQFICIGTDLVVDDSECKVSLKEDKISVETEDDQSVCIHVENESEDQSIDISTEKLNAFDLGKALVQSVQLNTTAISIEVGKTALLSAAFNPSTAIAELTWSSSNTRVATVSKDGVIYAITPGTTDITVSAAGKTATCKVTVLSASSGQSESKTDMHPVKEDKQGSVEQTQESIPSLNILKRTLLKSVKNIGKGLVQIKWKKVKSAKGYEVQYALDKKFKKNTKTKYVKSAKKTSLSIKKLKKDKTFYVRVRAYALDGNKKVYGKWSSKKKIKIKK